MAPRHGRHRTGRPRAAGTGARGAHRPGGYRSSSSGSPASASSSARSSSAAQQRFVRSRTTQRPPTAISTEATTVPPMTMYRSQASESCRRAASQRARDEARHRRGRSGQQEDAGPHGQASATSEVGVTGGWLAVRRSRPSPDLSPEDRQRPHEEGVGDQSPAGGEVDDDPDELPAALVRAGTGCPDDPADEAGEHQDGHRPEDTRRQYLERLPAKGLGRRLVHVCTPHGEGSLRAQPVSSSYRKQVVR